MNLLLATDFAPEVLARWADTLRAALPGVTVHTTRGVGIDAQIDMALVANPPQGALAGLPKLRLVQSMWAGVERLLRDHQLPDHVQIARMVDPAMNTAMAETALWAVLNLHRGFFQYAAQQRAGRWQPLPQHRADRVQVLVLGLGQMGRTTALRLAANGYRVSGWSQRHQVLDGVHTAHGDPALPGLLHTADIVLNLLPLTAHTQALFGPTRLAQMKRGAGLVNLARGAHVVDDALLAALDAGHIGHAVLDVFTTEPLPADHRYWTHPQVTVLPHAAALTDLETATAVAVTNLRAFIRGEPLAHRVDRSRGY